MGAISPPAGKFRFSAQFEEPHDSLVEMMSCKAMAFRKEVTVRDINLRVINIMDIGEFSKKNNQKKLEV